MSIHTLYQKQTPVVSVELFPPKKEAAIESIYQTLDGLSECKPDFISVTYGAGGSDATNQTLQLASLIKNDYNMEALHHLTCITNTKAEIQELLSEMQVAGVENVLALRGDIPTDKSSESTDFHFSKDLITTIKEVTDFSVGAACYPEGHISQLDCSENMKHLKEKAEAGADFFISQLFFDNEVFYRLMEDVSKAGIQTPISAGIMPLLSKQQIERMIFMCGSSLPAELIKVIHKYEHSPNDLRQAGLEYALKQMEELASNGVSGIHVYAMNRPEIAKAAMQCLRGG